MILSNSQQSHLTFWPIQKFINHVTHFLLLFNVIWVSHRHSEITQYTKYVIKGSNFVCEFNFRMQKLSKCKHQLWWMVRSFESCNSHFLLSAFMTACSLFKVHYLSSSWATYSLFLFEQNFLSLPEPTQRPLITVLENIKDFELSIKLYFIPPAH